MTFNDYQEVAATTANPNLRADTRLMCAALGLAGESGEVADSIKKHFGHGHHLDAKAVRKELGDILWYVSDICTQFKWRLEDVANENAAKLKARYPEGFSTERSVNRVE